VAIERSVNSGLDSPTNTRRNFRAMRGNLCVTGRTDRSRLRHQTPGFGHRRRERQGTWRRNQGWPTGIPNPAASRQGRLRVVAPARAWVRPALRKVASVGAGIICAAWAFTPLSTADRRRRARGTGSRRSGLVITLSGRQFRHVVVQPFGYFSEFLSAVVERSRRWLCRHRDGGQPGRRFQHSQLPHQITTGG
jgi:hypothetical protein